MVSYQARNLLRPTNLSGDLTGGCMNNFIAFFATQSIENGILYTDNKDKVIIIA